MGAVGDQEVIMEVLVVIEKGRVRTDRTAHIRGSMIIARVRKEISKPLPSFRVVALQ